MKNILYILLFLAFHNLAVGGNNDKAKASVKNVSGTIKSVRGEEIAAAKITVKETGESYFADLEGNFKFQLKTDKTYSISIEVLGYAPLEVKSTDLTLFSELSLKELN
ncbi:MAG: carboxypeptidase-like regulatory domain-containing protein [Bacteroidetes bacterium]|nr:carboxypeptidase-like regulatory domain-containing protein [Bacteroidota bacterium]